MTDINSKDYTYANLLIMNIKRMIDESEIEHRDFSDAEIVMIALNILRIMSEMIYGNGTEDFREWELFFNAHKSEKEFQFLLHHLERMSLVKNELLNEIMTQTETEDLEKFIKTFKGDGKDVLQ